MYLVLFGTGLRGAGTGAASARLGGVDVPVQAVAAHGKFEGLDQVNLGPLPGEIAGRRGVVDLVLTIEGIRANTVTVAPTYPPRGSWNRRADLLEANSEMAVALLDGKVFVLGGYPASRVTVPTVQVYDPATDSWTLTAPLPVAVNHPMPAAVNGKLYLIGGQTDANTAYVDNVQEYDPATRSWRQLARMPTQRGAGAAVVIEGKIYVAGGRPPRGADFAVYDPAQDQWTQLPNLPTQRNHLAAAAIGGKMYVVGGRFEGGFQSAQSDAVEIYDPQTNAWTNGAAMPKPRGGLNAVAAHGCLHVFGGEFGAGVHPDHDLYNPITNTWTSLDRMPTPVHGVTGAVFVDGLIYLPGGGISQGGSSGSRVHQVYRPNHACR
jgi:N-acetylneuraminic acid mutarotase